MSSEPGEPSDASSHKPTFPERAGGRVGLARASRSGWGTWLLIQLAVTAGLLLLLELMAIPFAPAPGSVLFDHRRTWIDGRPFVTEDPKLGFRLVANYRSNWLNTNAEGLRVTPSEQASASGPESSAAPEFPSRAEMSTPAELEILCVGESTVFGWMVPDSDTWPSFLERRLRESGGAARERSDASTGPDERKWARSVRVVNAGVPSYSSTQQRMHLAELLERRRPGLILISTQINDLLWSGLVHWYPEVLVFQQPPAWRRTLVRNSALVRLLTTRAAPEAPMDRSEPRALPLFLGNLEAMIDMARARGIPVALVAPPYEVERIPADGSPYELRKHTRFTRDGHARLMREWWEASAALARRRGALVVDHPLSLTGRGRPELFLDFCHPTGAGNRIIGERLADELGAAGLVSGRQPARGVDNPIGRTPSAH
jgi:lysophospholipase L1-like esterase